MKVDNRILYCTYVTVLNGSYVLLGLSQKTHAAFLGFLSHGTVYPYHLHPNLHRKGFPKNNLPVRFTNAVNMLN